MIKFIRNNYFPFLILLITFFSVNQWNPVPIGNTFITWFVQFLTVFYIIKFHSKHPIKYPIISIYLIWLLIGILRGAFIAENYWEWKQLIEGSFSLLLPLFAYVFTYPKMVIVTLRFWVKYALLAFFLFFAWVLVFDSYHFYLGPILLLTCLFPLLPKKWKLICTILILIMLVGDLGARSQVIKAAMSIIIALGCYYRKYVTYKMLKATHWICYLLPLILLYLGISGQFNIFEDASKNDKYTKQTVVNGQVVEENLSVDTRTFIYREVITSALNHNYVIWGRTPARGNDSASFGEYFAEFLKTGKYERHSNELCHTNVFTWLGLIGVILYSLIYFRSSYLAVYRSNNFYIKILGCFIAFRWAYGWIEDFNRFDIMNISLWMIIAMGLSSQFRKMNDSEFTNTIKSIFSKK